MDRPLSCLPEGARLSICRSCEVNILLQRDLWVSLSVWRNTAVTNPFNFREDTARGD